jgi:hypothetical protein
MVGVPQEAVVFEQVIAKIVGEPRRHGRRNNHALRVGFQYAPRSPDVKRRLTRVKDDISYQNFQPRQ